MIKKFLAIAIILGILGTFPVTPVTNSVECDSYLESALLKDNILYLKYRNNCTWEVSIIEVPMGYLYW